LPLWAGRALAASLLLGALAGLARAQSAPDCSDLVKRLDRIVAHYVDAGSRAIEKEDPGPALDRARKDALKGDAGATVAMIGIPLILRGRQDMFSVATIRQVCTFAERNGLLLHVAACAYFVALNPLGEKDEKRAMLEAMLARFASSRPDAPVGAPVSRAALQEEVEALRACLPRA